MGKITVVLSLIMSFSLLASDSAKINISGTNKVINIGNVNLDSYATVYYKGPVRDKDVDVFVASFKKLQSEDNKVISIVINSPGGQVDSGNRMVDIVIAAKEIHKVKVVCYIEGQAASMAAILMTYCSKTYISKRATTMFHEIAFGMDGSVSEMVRRVLHVAEYADELELDLASQMGITMKQYREFMFPEHYFTASQAAKFGLVDGVYNTISFTEQPTPIEDSKSFIIKIIDNLKELMRY